MDLEADLNTTQELLDDTLPGGIVDSVVQDDSEEEVFFGNISSKERNGKNAKFNRRRTIGVKESDRRRSFEVSKSSSSIKSMNQRSSLYGSQGPILEESEGFNEGFAKAENEMDCSPEAASVNLSSENIGDVMDGSLSMEDGNRNSHQKRNQGSSAYEGFRSDKDLSSSKFHSNNSFSMGKEKEKDNTKCSKKDNVFPENKMDLDISYSPLGHTGKADSSKIFGEDVYLDHPQPVIEDSFTTKLKVLDKGGTPINNSLSVNNDETTEDSSGSPIDVLESLTESEIVASDISKVAIHRKESLSLDGSFRSNDKNFHGAVKSPDAPENDSSVTNSPDKLPRPEIESNMSTDQSDRDVEESFFSNLASINSGNVTNNGISGVEPFDIGCPKSLINGSLQSGLYVPTFQRSKIDKLQIDNSNLEPVTGDIFAKAPSPTEQEPILCGDENKFLSSSESCQRESQLVNESQLNVSARNSNALHGISLEMGESLSRNNDKDASSGGSSNFSSKHLATHLQNCSSNTKLIMDGFHQQKVEIEDDHSEIQDLEEQMECHLDSNKQDWETSELENIDNDEDENPLNDILDVDNDQLFDDSLYSLSDNTSHRLSRISNKICQTWEEREMKTKKNINANASNNENVNSNEDSFCSVLESLPNSKDASVQEEQEEFDNTADEMALYEMFGEHYDQVVEEMTGDEKKKLRKKLDSRTEQDHLKTEEKLKMELAVSSSPPPTVSTNCKGTILSPQSPSFAISRPLPSSISSCLKTSAMSTSPSFTSLGAADNVPLLDDKPQNFKSDIPTEQDYHHQPKSPERSFSTDSMFKSPTHFRQPISPARSTSSESLFKSPTYLQPTTASLYKRVNPSPSPAKPIPWMPVSPHCNKSFIPVPVHSGTSARTPLKAITPLKATPKLTGAITPLKATTQLAGAITPLKVNPKLTGAITPLKATPQLAGATRTPGSSAKTKLGSSRAMVSPSPLGTYLRDNKPPPLVEQVKAQPAVRDLESTLMEVENEAPEAACPLPEARYYKPSLAKEHLSDATNKDYNIAEAYGQTNTLAKVTRHVGRMKLTGIPWEEELTLDQSLMSPTRGQFGLVGKSVLRKTQRDSGTPDESMVDMSVLETVAIKKIAKKDVKDNY